MSNYKIVEDPTVVPEGVSVSETSKNGDSIVGIIDESTVVQRVDEVQCM